jgi:glycosyltransferase involved in cell wall biosynthesis
MAQRVPRTPLAWCANRTRSLVRFTRFTVQNFALMKYVQYVRPLRVEKGKVTVITPTYRRLDKLKEAMACVRSQTYPRWEHIIVSDGFDPQVQNLVASVADAAVQYHHTRHISVMGNYQRNTALLYATGEFVLYLDDDNLIEPHCLATMVSGFQSDDIGYVVAPIRYGGGMKQPKPGFRYREIDLLNYMVRRRLVERVGGQSADHSADYFLIDKIRRISQGAHLDVVIGHHR